MRAVLVALVAGALASVTFASSSPGRASLRACTARDLRPLGGTLQGATGSMVGFISFRNASATRCRVGRRPAVVILSLSRKPLRTLERPLTRAAVGGVPVTSVAAGRRVGLFLQWSNWCGDWPSQAAGFRPLLLRVRLTTGLGLTVRFRSGRPRCDHKGISTLGVSAFGAVK
jgi:hypothetical protein